MNVDEIQALIHELQVHRVELEVQNEQLRDAQVELEEARDRYLELYDFAPVGYLTLDLTGTILDANLAAADLLGVDRRSLIQARLSRFIARDFQDTWYLLLQRFSVAGVKETCELELVKSDGVPVFVQFEGVSARDEKRENSRIQTCVVNITRRKQLEEDLRELNAGLEQRVTERTGEYRQALEALQRDEAWLRGLVETTQDAVVSIDRQGCVVLFNPAAERIFGFDKTEVQGHKVNMLMAEPHASEHDAYIKHYEATGEPRAIGRIRTVEARRKNGEVFPIELSVTEIEQDDEVHYAAFIRDTSEKKRLETQLIDRERLAAVGATAAAVAHEIGNPLNSISMTVQLIERKLAGLGDPGGQDITPKVKAVRKEIQRLTELLGDFTFLARKKKDSVEPCSLETLCGEIMEIEEQRFTQSGIRVEQFFPGDLAWPGVDRDRFRQALINLFKNAAEAMPDGGILSVRAWNEQPHVVLEIGDTGAGVPEGIDIFAPFTTTKSKGTGLGMMIVRKIIADHAGTITCDGQPGKGAVFRLKLPCEAAV